MYSCEKPHREEKQSKSRRTQKDMPSFSSTLLDEIYRSIDGGAEKPEDFRAYREKLAVIKKQSINNRAPKTHNTTVSADDGDAAARSFRRARLVEKWMEKEKEKEKKPAPRKSPNPELYHNSDVLFFSSTSSSNSDSSGALSSSDTEFFGPQTKPPKVSCFTGRPKPVRTGGPARLQPEDEEEDDFTLFGDYQNNEKNKSRALKLYANLKKANKQPISPGGRLTNFINSLFKNNPNSKKSKKPDPDNKSQSQSKSRSKSESQSACSSATSYSRSCLIKNSKTRDGPQQQRMVRFHPGLVDEARLRPGDRHGKPPLPTRDHRVLADSKVAGINDSKGYNGKMDEDEEDEDDYDGLSDSSSDLFELDHMSLFGSNRFCEELPVYETTRIDTNHAIASRLMR